MEILDVSRWQGNVDWKKVKASGKVDGVMLRTVSTSTAYGGIYIDPTFEKNYWGCVEAGLPVGAYYYTKAITAIHAAQELAKLQVALEGKDFTLPIAVDVEDPSLKALRPEELAKLVKMEAKQIEAWGLYAMVYTYTNFADTALAMHELTDFDLWIADYRGKRPTRDVAVHEQGACARREKLRRPQPCLQRLPQHPQTGRADPDEGGVTPMWQFLMEYWAQWVCTLIGAGILAALPKIKALWGAVLALLHDRIYTECYRFMELGYITQDGLRNLGYLYKTYHMMGGNGTGTELYNRAKALPIHTV